MKQQHPHQRRSGPGRQRPHRQRRRRRSERSDQGMVAARARRRHGRPARRRRSRRADGALHLAQPVLPHGAQLREPPQPGGDARDARHRARLRAAAGRDRPVRRRHRRCRDGAVRRAERAVRHPVAPRAAHRLRLRHHHRRAHRLLRGQGGDLLVRSDTGPVPGLPGPCPRHHRSRRPLPPRGARAAGDPERQPAGLGRMGDARRHARDLGGDVVLGSRPPHACRGAQPRHLARVDQARRHRRHRRGGRLHPQLRPRAVGGRRPGRSDHRADRARDPVDRHLRARPHEVRPLHLRDRRQRRGGTPFGRQGALGQVDGVRHLLLPRRHLRALQRGACRLGGRDRRSRHRADCFSR